MKLAKYLTPILTLAALAACDSSTSGEPGRVSVRLVDAPGNLAEAWVQIEQIYLVGADAEGDSLSPDTTRGRLQLVGPSSTYYNLVELQDGNFAELVRDAVVPAGSYSALRIVIGEAYVVTTDGDVYATPGAALPGGATRTGTLQVTRGRASGYQVKLSDGGLQVEGDRNIILLDFDVRGSFGHVAGNSGRFVLHPKMFATEIETAEVLRAITGNVAISGVTFPVACGGTSLPQDSVLAKFTPTATRTGEAARTGTTTAAGAFTIANLPAGSYTLGADSVTFTNGNRLIYTAAATPATVTIAGANATASYAVTAVACRT